MDEKSDGASQQKGDGPSGPSSLPESEAKSAPIRGADDADGAANAEQHGKKQPQNLQGAVWRFVGRWAGRLTLNEWLTLIVAVSTLAVSYQTYRTSQDTKELAEAVTALSTLAKASNAQTAALQAQATATGAQARALAGQLNVMTEAQRPRIEVLGAAVIAPLHFDAKGASIGVRFDIKNVGGGVAEYAFPFADFYPDTSRRPDQILQHRKALCERVRHLKVVTKRGASVFGGQPGVVLEHYEMTRAEVDSWIAKKDSAVPRLVGCIDYLVGQVHHQTPFVYELDRADQSNPYRFLGIDPTAGDLPVAALVLPTNFNIVAKSD